MSIEIIPAIMPDNWKDLTDKASRVAGITAWAQIDVMDGVFVSSHSWPYTGSGLTEMRVMKEEKQKLPNLDKLSYEVDLMVATPEVAAPDWMALGAKRVIVHIESVAHIGTFLQSFKARFSDVEIGFAINIDTPNDVLDSYIDKIDLVQFMGIAQIGYQGEQFDERVMQKILELRGKNKEVIISVDGGVNFETAPKLIEAGVNRLASGSAIFKSDNIEQAVQALAPNFICHT